MADWSLLEVDLIIADYFSMLSSELAGKKYNKTEHRKALLKLVNRNDGSIEFKHCNITAVLIKLGQPFIKGYQPRNQYQKLLEERVIAYLSEHKKIYEPQFASFAQSPNIIVNPIFQFSNLLEPAPDKQIKHILNEAGVEYNRRPIKINYLEREQRNSTLGAKGEQFVLEYEKWNLINLGKEALADKVEWIAQHDDGAGFDILSKQTDGTDKYIEVKTTKLSKDAPIFFSKNEYEFAQQESDKFKLYRLFNFAATPKMFVLSGNYDSFCNKEATQYQGTF